MIPYPLLCSGRSCTNSCLHWLTSTSTSFLSLTSSTKYLPWQTIKKKLHNQAPCEESKTCFIYSNTYQRIEDSRLSSFVRVQILELSFLYINNSQSPVNVHMYRDKYLSTTKSSLRQCVMMAEEESDKKVYLVTIYEMVSQLLHWSPSSDCIVVVSSRRIN